MVRKRARPILRLLLLLGGTLLALLLAEGVLRVFPDLFKEPADVETHYPIVSPAATGAMYGLEPLARFTGTYDGDPYRVLPEGGIVEYRTNEHGFRDGPLPLRTASGAARIAILGDSFTFGEGVRQEDRFSDVCAGILGRSAKIVNLGVSGYSSYEQLAVARWMLPRLRPRITVLAYCLNDPVPLHDESYVERMGFDLIMIREEALDRAARDRGESMSSGSLLLDRLKRVSRSRRLRRETIAWYRRMYEGADAPWVRSREAILEIRDAAAAVDSELVLVILPILVRTGDGYPFAEIHRTIRQWSEAAGIPVLDTLPVVRGHAAETLVVHPKDHHPNAAAHALFGRAIAEFLRERLGAR